MYSIPGKVCLDKSSCMLLRQYYSTPLIDSDCCQQHHEAADLCVACRTERAGCGVLLETASTQQEMQTGQD